MICSAARMRLRLLSAAPVMVLVGLCWHAGGAAAALLLWLGMASLLPCRERYPYPRKRKLRAHTLFFCFSLTAFLIGGAAWAVRRFFAPGFLWNLLFYMGAAGFSLPMGKRALSLPLPRWLAWGLGGLLCALFLASLIFQTPRI
ncbi:MAG: hypothetical protein IJP78_01925 [Clostridia bacterium]|nr:hypothetical protein [Clostridia bacterium]